ncbi:MAG: phosphoenolpyruvate synthase [Patescibacteria group bacterium]|nr:phosphoenolpyruvate synthase [Patescibacteria group bacterium]
MKKILWFNEIGIKDVNIVGGKNASLGEMYQNLTKHGVLIPNGFAITADAYWHFLESAKIKEKIKEILKDFNKKDLVSKGTLIRGTILNADFPKDLKEEIISAYKKLSSESKKKNIDVAVRSSATAEDAPDASFAGQQESYLNIKGEKELLLACKRCMSSLFTDRSISYRLDKKISLFDVALSVCVQKMVRSDKASAGVMFTLDPESGFKNVIVINGAYGLGENIVKGRVIPDEFCVHKELLKRGFKPIVGKTLGKKENALIYTDNLSSPTANIKVSEEKRNTFVLDDKEILELAKFGLAIDEHYKRPMDIEWAKDGDDNKLYIVQARPETIHKKENEKVFSEYYLAKKGEVLLEGAAIGSKIGQGKVQLILDVKNIEEFNEGDILVTTITDPDWEPVMRKAKAIITDSGGRTCHAAIVSRELGIPCIVGTGRATEILKDHQEITVSCAEGEIGKVYKGLLPIKTRKIDLTNLKKTRTKIMMNIGVPLEAFALTTIPNDGVGLAREEFIIANSIKVHPKALLKYPNLKDKQAKEKIAEITKGYKDKSEFFIDQLAWGMGRIAAAFYPNDVIVRTSDFKTNEYASLIGGREFEPKESNPMIGWRGASRYYDEKYKDAFIMECKAFKKLREEMGFTNVKIMIPFCRTPEEGKKVLSIMKEHGLERGKDKLEVYVMVEIPSNVILADQFAKIFDGFSIGTNDLTQLALGVDRDSSIVAHVYDERNEAVKTLVKQAIEIAHKNKIKIGICGDAPSTFPDFAQFLIDNKIDSLSLSPDAVFKTTLEILKKEK